MQLIHDVFWQVFNASLVARKDWRSPRKIAVLTFLHHVAEMLQESPR